jgi:hypothetical protein
MSAFTRYIGINYSGAETPTASLKGLRVYCADSGAQPLEVQPPPSPHRLLPDWPTFLDDFQRHWPTDENIYVDFVRDGIRGKLIALLPGYHAPIAMAASPLS